MVKKIRIIVGNSAYKDNSGFGYSRLKVGSLKKSLKNYKLKKIYKKIPEIAFIPIFEAKFPEEYYKYFDVISFRRLIFLLFEGEFSMFKGEPEEIAAYFYEKNIYLVNACGKKNKPTIDNLSRLINNIIVERFNCNENYEVHVLYTGENAIKIKGKLGKDKRYKLKEYIYPHPSARGKHQKTCSECWINFTYNGDIYSDSKSVLKAFREK